MLKAFKLKNGIKVATFSIPQMRSIYLTEIVKGGSILDTPETSGAAHFMEHLLVQATPSFPNVEALSDFIEGMAGRYNASTSRLEIDFNISGPAQYNENIIRIASEVFFEPLFPEEAIERERGAVLEEIRQNQDSPNFKNSLFWSKIRYSGEHPFKLWNGGSVDAVSKLQRADLVKFWSNIFQPENTYIVIVGNLDHLEIKKYLTKYYGRFKNKHQKFGFPKLTNQTLSGRTVAIREDLELKTCYLDLSFPSVSLADLISDRISQTVILYILGGLRRSRLFRLLRQRRGLVYDVGFSHGLLPNFGYGDIYSQVSVEKLDEVVQLIVSELASFVSEGPTDEEVEFAKNYYANQILMQFDHPSGIGYWIEGGLIWDKKIMAPEEFNKLVEKVTREDIVKFMKKNWDFKKLNLVIQGPIKDSKENLAKFEKMVTMLQ